MSIRNFTLLIISLVLVQCSSHSKMLNGFNRNSDSKFILGKVETDAGYVSSKFMKNLKENITHDLKANDLLYSNTSHSLHNVYELDIKIKKYKVLGGAARDVFGVFAGRDTVLSDIKLIDMATHQIVGEYLATTTDGSGIKYKDAQLAKSHSKEIVKFIGGQ